MTVFDVGVKLISVVILTSSKSITSDLASNHCNSNNSVRHNKDVYKIHFLGHNKFRIF
jgi:hypothetical protein